MSHESDFAALASLFSERRYDEARILAQAILTTTPLLALAWKVLGAACQMLGRKDEAMSAMRQAAVIAPDDADIQNNLGTMFRDRGEGVSAGASYRRAMRIAPDMPEPHNNYGALLKSMRRFAEAEASYRMALLFRPSYSEAQLNLANTLRDLRKMAEATIHASRGVSLDPQASRGHFILGLVLQEMDDDAAALEEFDKALARENANQRRTIRCAMARSLQKLGVQLGRQGRFIEAKEAFQRVFLLHTTYAPLSNPNANSRL